MKSVCFVTNADISGRSGKNVATREMVSAFTRAKNIKFYLISPKPKHSRAREIYERVDENFFVSEKERSIGWHLRTQIQYLKMLNKCRSADIVIVRANPSIFFPAITSQIFSQEYTYLIRGLSTINYQQDTPLSNIARLITALNCKSADNIIVAYEKVKNVIKENNWTESEKVLIFPNAVNSDLFIPKNKQLARHELDLPFTQDDFIIGFVGSLRERHKINQLLRSLAIQKEQGNDIKAIIAGDGPQRDTLEQFCLESGLAEQVKFTGHVEHEYVPEYIAACDILYGVVPKKHPSNPIKCYEYLSCARPIITSRVPEFAFINEIEAGMLIDRVDTKSIVGAIEQAYTMNGAELNSMGQRGREYVIENHTWDKLVEVCTG